MSDAADFAHDSPLWRYAVTLYGRPGVSGWLLGLQNRLAVDVNFALFACWCGEHGLELTDSDWRQLGRDTATLREAVIAPLRRQRIRLDGIAPSAVRNGLLQAELAAENALYDPLWTWWRARAGSFVPVPPLRSRSLCAGNLNALARFHTVEVFADAGRLLDHVALSVG